MGTYLEIARRLRTRGDGRVGDDESPQRPIGSAEACAECGSALGWRDAAGAVTCAECLPEPAGGERVVLVNLAERNEWRNYDAERREHERRRGQLGQGTGDEPRRRVNAPTADEIDRLNDALDEAAADERLDDELPERDYCRLTIWPIDNIGSRE